MRQHQTFTLCVIFLIIMLVPSAAKADGDVLSVKIGGAEAYEGDKIVLRATITGGKAPFSVTWYDNMMQPFFNDAASEDSRKITATITATRTCDFSVKVTDAEGSVATDVQRIFVNTTDTRTATFEDVYLGNSTYTSGTYYESYAPAFMKGWDTSFVSGGFIFHSLSSTIGTWNTGVTCTNVLTDDFELHNFNVHFASAAGGAYDNSKQYATITDSAYICHAGVCAAPRLFTGFYITSSAELHRSVVNGSDLSPAFTYGDYAYVNIRDEVTGRSVDYYLADYRSENMNEHYCLTSWQWVDLRSLGMSGDRLKLTFHSSRTPAPGASGFCMPGMFCIDNFNGTPEISVAPVQNVESGQRIPLSKFLPQINNGASITYSIYDIEGAYPEDSRFDIDGSFLRITASQCNVRVTIKEFTAGYTWYVTIPVVINGEQAVADFESLFPGSGEYVPIPADNFTDGSYKFVSDTCSGSGFGYSALSGDNSLRSWRYHAAAAMSGHGDSDTYAVMRDSGYVYSMTPDAEISGFYVTNSLATYSDVLEGYSYLTRKFEHGDSLVLTIVNPENGVKVNYPLADYRSDNEADHYCLDTWQWVDLRPLGKINSVRLYLTSSQMLSPGEYGYSLLPQCCIDDFGGSREVKELPAISLTLDERHCAEVLLSDYFNFLDAGFGATVTYAVDELIGVHKSNSVYVDGDRLCFEINEKHPFTVIVRAFCRGDIRYVSIPVTFATGIDSVSSESLPAEQFTTDGIRIGDSPTGGTVTIVRNSDGSVKKILTK